MKRSLIAGSLIVSLICGFSFLSHSQESRPATRAYIKDAPADYEILVKAVGGNYRLTLQKVTDVVTTGDRYQFVYSGGKKAYFSGSNLVFAVPLDGTQTPVFEKR